jgi:predicted HTH transcriptional regulator
VPKDITAEQRILHEQWIFNSILSASAFGVAVLIALYFIGREIVMPPRHVSLDEALLQKEENENIEFKPALNGDFGNRDLRLEALKTIAAFMNTSGGTLFIGVLNDGTVCGIDDNLKRFDGSRDGFRCHLGNLITDRIGADCVMCVRDYFEEKDGRIVYIIAVEKSLKPAFVKWDSDNLFFVRQGSRTIDLDAKETARWLGLFV